MSRVLILADDLTGAADCAAAFLGRAREVRVSLDARSPARRAVTVVDLNTRSRPERAARSAAKRAFSSQAARAARILYKKIDSTLRGHVSAELAAIRHALGGRPVLFAPAFPGQGRTSRDARLFLDGKPSSTDLRTLITSAGLPAAHIGLPSIRSRGLVAALRTAMRDGARGLICDALTDADLDLIARAGLALRPRPLFMGSAGLARALARTLPPVRVARPPKASPRTIVTVVGSASPVSRRQAGRLAGDRDSLLVQMTWTRTPSLRDIGAVRQLGRLVAQSAPRAHLVLTGGETARTVLSARGIREFQLLGEVEPGVPFGMARDGTLVCTKAGAFGGLDTLVKCVARLKREMNRP